MHASGLKQKILLQPFKLNNPDDYTLEVFAYGDGSAQGTRCHKEAVLKITRPRGSDAAAFNAIKDQVYRLGFEPEFKFNARNSMFVLLASNNPRGVSDQYKPFDALKDAGLSINEAIRNSILGVISDEILTSNTPMRGRPLVYPAKAATLS